MRLFRHYKKKFYRYINEAKHTENLEDVVFYECLYENPSGQFWVRPKSMFFETVEIDGRVVPRFAEVAPEIETATEMSKQLAQEIGAIAEEVFAEPAPDFFARLRGRMATLILIARIDGKAVGFKVGYEEDPDCFYSWLGGVRGEFRGLGIARTLMLKQHEWCLAKGYRKVRTKTLNRFREMLLLNIKAGFNIIGLHESDDGGSKIILEKKLR